MIEVEKKAGASQGISVEILSRSNKDNHDPKGTNLVHQANMELNGNQSEQDQIKVVEIQTEQDVVKEKPGPKQADVETTDIYSKELLDSMIALCFEHELAEIYVPFYNAVDRLSWKGISMDSHLKFGKQPSHPIKHTQNLNGCLFVGEMNPTSKKLSGKGIRYNGDIHIGYLDKNADAPGKYVKICSNRDIEVGEITKKGEKELKYQFVRYKEDGSSQTFEETKLTTRY